VRFALDLQPENEKRVIFPAWTWAILGILFISLALHWVYRNVNHLDPAAEIREKIVKLENEKELLITSLNAPSATASGAQESRKMAFLNSLATVSRFSPFDLFQTIESAFDQDMVLDTMETVDGVTIVTGFARTLDDIYQANNKLLDSSGIADVKMKHRAASEEESREKGKGLLQFTFQMSL
jgi:hypothetical protein